MSRVCSIPDCGAPHKGKGFCHKHYQRWQKHGDPMIGAATTRSGEAREFFQSVVIHYEGDDCLVWPFAIRPDGYGAMKGEKTMSLVSRVLCEEIHGAPPTPDHEAAHSCGNGKYGCVTKRHVSWKTHADNMADTIGHGSSTRGERHPLAKITEAQVREILSLKGKEFQKETAKRFGISRAAVSDIHRGRNWGWIQRQPSVTGSHLTDCADHRENAL